MDIAAEFVDAEGLVPAMREAGLGVWAESLPRQLHEAFCGAHGRFEEWRHVLEQIRDFPAGPAQLDSPVLTVGDPATLYAAAGARLRGLFQQLHPWRKGPFSVHGIHIDSEWRSDRKWSRLAPHIHPLRGRVVLDVGAGNGYYAWRMAGQGARLVVGIDPTWIFMAQFAALRHFLGAQWPVYLLPLGVESVPQGLAAFDTVFSMGVLYHRRSPRQHLAELREALKPGGELVLESLVLDEPGLTALSPEGRYAKMRNLWCIPSVAMLVKWLRDGGFEQVRVLDLSTTTPEEQRRTDWMRYESLSDFLDPEDPTLTIEGYPAPRRAVLCAVRPAG
ncbi:MAG: tRNA 5-methoxyuridine(34)/uridine 5-oxyacetic acid(34) synthase CmoB [Pseudomonadota bacterium]